MAGKAVTLDGGAGIEKALRDIARKLDKAGTVRAGFLEDATYPDGTSVAMVAAVQNFGAPGANIPARPFFTNVVAAGKRTWPVVIAKIAKGANYDGKLTMHRFGEHLVSEIQDSIRNTNDPALKPATVAAKGFAKPLIDTSVMINSAAYEVDES